MTERYHLYFDDTGNRDPDKAFYDYGPRDDAMDCFGLGGILIKESDIDALIAAHKAFCHEQNITYPLHSRAIRGGRGEFGWLKTPERAGIFLGALEEHLLSLPITCISCVVSRPGYVPRYKQVHKEKLWFMCKIAFSILIERAAKHVDACGGTMEIYFEQTGKKEDRDLIRYMRDLKSTGLEFSSATSAQYTPFTPEDFRRVCLGKPARKTKATPMIQIADLVLYPMAKAGYDPEYRPFAKLKQAGKLIDCLLDESEIPLHGIKYSCFDDQN